MSRALLVLENFLALSEAMAKAAMAQEWDSLVQVGEQRGTLLDTLPADLSSQLPPAEQIQARSIIERCQHLDSQIRLLVEERQNAVRVLLHDPKPVS